MTHGMPALQIRHTPDEEWIVRATWPDGRFEEIKGFETESAANDWIAQQFDVWLGDAERRTQGGLPKAS